MMASTVRPRAEVLAGSSSAAGSELATTAALCCGGPRVRWPGPPNDAIDRAGLWRRPSATVGSTPAHTHPQDSEGGPRRVAAALAWESAAAERACGLRRAQALRAAMRRRSWSACGASLRRGCSGNARPFSPGVRMRHLPGTLKSVSPAKMSHHFTSTRETAGMSRDGSQTPQGCLTGAASAGPRGDTHRDN